VLASTAAIAVPLVGCGALAPILEPGSREWIITVQNDSNQPAVLVVAEDMGTPGQVVGSADPPTVPPRTSMEVAFRVPPGEGWAIFVNPGPGLGPLILAQDVPPNAAGDLPLTMFVAEDGSPSVSAPGEPGWFGN
jgi:hypothetical protein